jgi:ABC-2 type transport system permease protein
LLAELTLLLRRRRTIALLGVLGAIPIVIAVAVRVSGGPGGGEGPTFLNQVTNNGVFASLAGLTISLPVFLPLAVSLVAGDAVAGEAGLGTLRYLLTRPAGRTRLLVVKTSTVVAFCLIAAIVVAAAGLVIGVALFPVGRITTLSGDTLPLAAGAIRVVGAALLVGLSLVGLAAIGIFISAQTDVAVGATAATLGVLILSAVLDAVPQLRVIHPWLITHDWTSLTDLLRTHVAWHGIVRNLERQATYFAIFTSAAWAHFTTKDILA